MFPEEGVNTQILLKELIHRAEILCFEQSLPSLNEIFIETVESAVNE
ncbi:MAG: DUF4162 domain-containing protein [Methanosarcina barkeri]|nr:DUF4162 domain-containing protein [Methanosarcina sp. ERenArc_MAG2]